MKRITLVNKNMQRLGSKNGKAVLTAPEVKAIRRLWEMEKLTQVEIGEAFGVTRAAVKHIVNGTSWNN